jgi:hypothetical protein
MKEENEDLKAQISQLLQPKHAASGAATSSNALVPSIDESDAEHLNDSEEASECTGTAGDDSRRSSCVSALESCRDSLLDSSGTVARDESACDDGSCDVSMLSAHDFSPTESAAAAHQSVSVINVSSSPQPLPPALLPNASSPSPVAADCFVEESGEVNGDQVVPPALDGACVETTSQSLASPISQLP